MLFLSQFMNGVQLGSIYALIALGYSMVYGIIMLLNFAHGDIIMVGGYLALLVVTSELHPAVAVIVAILGCMLLAMLVEKLAYAPLRSAPRISLLITAIGVSLLLQNLAQLIFTATPKTFPNALFLPTGTLKIGEFAISYVTIVTIVVSIISMVLLMFLVSKTKMGKAMRAVSEDTQAAQLMGINVNSVVSFTFAVGSGLAGIASILYCCRYPIVSPTMGSMLGLKAFVAAVLGGIGSIPGAVIGGFVIGLSEVLVTALGYSTWADGIVFAILIVVLVFRPTGFMGRSMREKV